MVQHWKKEKKKDQRGQFFSFFVHVMQKNAHTFKMSP